MPKKGTTNTPGEVLSSAAGGSAGGSFAEDGDQAEALERARLARDWMCVSDTSREVSATITLDGNRVDVSCIEVLLYGRRVPNTTKIATGFDFWSFDESFLAGELEPLASCFFRVFRGSHAHAHARALLGRQEASSMLNVACPSHPAPPSSLD